MTTRNGKTGRNPQTPRTPRGPGRLPSYQSAPSPKGVRWFTAGQLATLFGVSPRTVCKWFDAGEFAGAYRIPGSLDRRFPLAGVIEFARQHGLPMPAGIVPTALLVGFPAALVARLAGELEAGKGLPCVACENGAEAAWEARGGNVAVVVVDVGSIGREQSLSLARLLKGRLQSVRLLGLLPDDARVTMLEGFDVVSRDASALTRAVEGGR